MNPRGPKTEALHPIQYAIQITIRAADAWAFGSSFAKLNFDALCDKVGTPSDPISFGLKASGIALNDVIGDRLLKPLVTEEKPYANTTRWHAIKQVGSTGTTFLIGFAVGCELDSKSLLTGGSTIADIFFQNPYSSSALIGLAGWTCKGAQLHYLLTHKDERDVLRAEGSPPENLHWMQRGAGYVFRFIGDVAWLEATRNALNYFGQNSISQDPRFMCAIMGADAIRETLIHFGSVPQPFNKLVSSEERKEEDRVLQQLEAGEAQPNAPTAWQIFKSMGSKAVSCVTSGAVVFAMDKAFTVSAVGEQYREKENHSDFAVLYRIAHQLALFTAYVGLPVAASYAKNRYSKWKEKRQDDQYNFVALPGEDVRVERKR